MTNLERMRMAAQQASGKPVPPKPPVPKLPQPKPKEKAKVKGPAHPPKGTKPPPLLRKEKVVFRCGCQRTPADISSMDCPQHRRIAKQQKAIADVKAGKPRHARNPRYLRLPVGTMKTIMWDGEKWRGTLLAPGMAGPVYGYATTEMHCCHVLHHKFIEWAEALAAANSPAASQPEPSGA